MSSIMTRVNLTPTVKKRGDFNVHIYVDNFKIEKEIEVCYTEKKYYTAGFFPGF